MRPDRSPHTRPGRRGRVKMPRTRDSRPRWWPGLHVATSGVLLTLLLMASATGAAQSQVPRPPADVDLVANRDLSITLSWTPSHGATSYRIYRGLAPGAEGSFSI